jgi:hypothetical protein
MEGNELEIVREISDETIEKIENIDWGTFEEFIEKVAREQAESE